MEGTHEAPHEAKYNLATLTRRLEALVSRLEDICAAHEAPAPTPDELPESITAYDTFLNSSVQEYVNQSTQLGGLVSLQAAQVARGFHEQRRFLLVASTASKPDQHTLDKLLQPTTDAIVAVTQMQLSNRFDSSYTHLTAVADGIRMLAWVKMQLRPAKFVEESLEAAQFFGNKILREETDKHALEATWTRSYYKVCRHLADYVAAYFPSGISWTVGGKPAELVARASAP